ncbi:DciA family protein [Acidihalobacter prosperus]
MKHASQYLSTDLLKQAAFLSDITRQLRSTLTPEMAAHTWFVGIDNHKALLLTDNGSWVTPLRFHQPLILGTLNALLDGQTLNRMIIRVSPEGIPSHDGL